MVARFALINACTILVIMLRRVGSRECGGGGKLRILGYIEHAGREAHGEQQDSAGASDDYGVTAGYCPRPQHQHAVRLVAIVVTLRSC